MWRKALTLAIVLMALGVVFGGAVEDSNAGATYKEEFLYGIAGGLLGGVGMAGGL